jgi:hypothetical protein
MSEPSTEPKRACPSCGGHAVRDYGVYVARTGDDSLGLSLDAFGTIDFNRHLFRCELCGAQWVASSVAPPSASLCSRVAGTADLLRFLRIGAARRRFRCVLQPMLQLMLHIARRSLGWSRRRGRAYEENETSIMRSVRMYGLIMTPRAWRSHRGSTAPGPASGCARCC